MWSSRLCVPLKSLIEYCNVLVVNVDGKFNCVMAIENDVGSAFAIHSVPIRFLWVCVDVCLFISVCVSICLSV